MQVQIPEFQGISLHVWNIPTLDQCRPKCSGDEGPPCWHVVLYCFPETGICCEPVKNHILKWGGIKWVPAFSSRLGGLEEEIISKKAGLVIIDSIASVVRKEFDTSIPGNLSERSSLLSQEAATLKYLAEEFSIPVRNRLFIAYRL